MLVLKGTPISTGIVEGPIFIKKNSKRMFNYTTAKFQGKEVEVSLYQDSLTTLIEELKSLKWNHEEVSDKTGQQMITLYNSLINDDFFKYKIPQCICDEQISAQEAILKKLALIKKDFDALDNEYFRARYQDFAALGNRILEILNGSSTIQNITDPVIFIAQSLSVADLLAFSKDKMLGIVTSEGGITSHAAILAESMEIPAIFGVKDLLSHVKNNQNIIMDAYKGEVIINPNTKTLENYRTLRQMRIKYENQIIESISQSFTTLDGQSLEIMVNVGSLHDITLAKKHHADGIGLLRTEVFCLSKNRSLNEEEHYQYYKEFLTYANNYPVTIRTVDLGGDKFLKHRDKNLINELNPFLGYRSTRMFIDSPDELKMQLRALIKASPINPKIKIMLPFISTLEDLLFLKDIYYQAADELKDEVPDGHKIPLGIMVEVPSVVICIDDFLPHIDFISIGTNDLTQYILAADRNNPLVARYYQNSHPSIIKLIYHVVQKANEFKIPVSLCGEMAKEAIYTRLFLGIGMRSLSMNPLFLPLVKFVSSHSNPKECLFLWKEIVKMKSAKEIDAFLEEDLNNFLKEKGAYFDGQSIFINDHLESS